MDFIFNNKNTEYIWIMEQSYCYYYKLNLIFISNQLALAMQFY